MSDEGDPWLSKLLEWTEGHLRGKLTVEVLAARAGMSKRTLARRFAEATGATPIDWVIGLRVARAKELLESKNLSVEELASQCGFTSAATLRHHFRERLLTSPAAYRARFAR